MFVRLLLLFTIVPILELALLIQVGRWIGTLPTIGIVALTALVGAWLAKREGIRAFRRVQAELAGGQVPGMSLLHGLAIFMGGTLLLTPGVLTDLFGLALLAPPTRGLIVRSLRKRLQVYAMRRTGEIEAQFWTYERRQPPGPDSPGRDSLP